MAVPLNILLKGREVAYDLNDSQARAYFCFEGGPDLPIGEYGHDGFNDAHGCADMFLLTAGPHAPSPIAGVETAAQAIAEMAAEFETVVRESTDTAVILYTGAPPDSRRARSSPTPTWCSTRCRLIAYSTVRQHNSMSV